MTVRCLGNGSRLVLPALPSGRFGDQSSIYLTVAIGRKACVIGRSHQGRAPTTIPAWPRMKGDDDVLCCFGRVAALSGDLHY